MARASRLCLIGIVLFPSGCFRNIRNGLVTFALPKQAGGREQRKRAGLSVHTPAAREIDVIVSRKGSNWVHTPGLVLEPTPEEKELASQFKARGEQKNGRWQKLFSNYTGSNPMVLNAAMHAAVKQREFEEAFNIYKRVRHMTLPTFAIAMPLLGRLGFCVEVERLCGQLVKLGDVNTVVASARIDAAAAGGDIEGAEAVLNYMVEESIETNVVHCSSVINACANTPNTRETDRARRAQELFDRMVAKGIKPNDVTYTNLLRAFKDEPSQCYFHLLDDMKIRNLKPNIVFAETFLFIFLKQPRKGCWTGQRAIVADIRKLELADLETAARFINELRGANVKLNRSCKLIDAAIQTILRKQLANSK